MKKLLTILFALLTLVPPLQSSYAQVQPDSLGYKLLAPEPDPEDLIQVKYFQVIDGDTVDLILDRDEEASIKARILLIDTPERKEVYFQEAKDRLHDLLTAAEKIHIEYEGARKDKYGRDLVHIWLDGILVQEVMVTEGYAIARYIHDYIPDSKYAPTIYASQDYAEGQGLGVWSRSPAAYLAKAERPQGQASSPQASQSQPEEDQSQQAGYYVDENNNGLIKGSRNKIYHVPGSTYYDRTTNPEAWFKSVQEAEEAGYRAPKR